MFEISLTFTFSFIKFIDSKGQKQWKCLWCGLTFQCWNATKALHHVNKVKRGDISKCKSSSIDAAHREGYARLLEKANARKNAQKLAMDSKKRSSDEYIAGAGEAYTATRKKKPSPALNLPTPPSQEISPANQVQTQLNFTSENQNENHSNPRYYQTKLTDLVDPQAESQLTMAIADLIHSCGLPFSLASHHKFHRVLSLAKFVTKKYIPPGRNKVAGELLDLNYDLYIKRTCELLQKEADVYGITFFGDATTVKKSPLINILASSVHLSVGCLRIVDCSEHLESDGKKDAAYISELFLPHILEMEKTTPRCTDLIIFDGASNVQKAGSLLEAKFPHISVIHGAEHVISLFYHDVFSTSPVRDAQEPESSHLQVLRQWFDALTLCYIFETIQRPQWWKMYWVTPCSRYQDGRARNIHATNVETKASTNQHHIICSFSTRKI
jgi:hypothetical protein